VRRTIQLKRTVDRTDTERVLKCLRKRLHKKISFHDTQIERKNSLIDYHRAAAAKQECVNMLVYISKLETTL